MKKYLIVFFLVSVIINAQWIQTNGPYSGTARSFYYDGTYLFAGTYGGVYRSADNGNNWTILNSGLTGYTVYSFYKNGSTLFAGTNSGVFKSINDGLTWEQSSGGSVTYALSLAYTPGKLLAGSNGLFFSEDNGITWIQNSGVPTANIWSILVDGNDIYVATQGYGVYYSANAGNDWSAVNNGIAATVIYGLAKNGDNIFCISNNAGVFRTTNKGTDWTAVNNGLTITSGENIFSYNNNLYAAIWGSGIFMSSNNGDSWTNISNGMDNTFIWYVYAYNNFIFTGNQGAGFYRSSNNGASWEKVINGVNSSRVYALTIHNENLVVGAWGAGVFRSINNGESFIEINNGLTNKYPSSIFADGDHYYVGHYEGVDRSLDAGSNWTHSSNGLSGTIYAFTKFDNKIFAAGSGGLYVTTNNGDLWTRIQNGLPSATYNSLLTKENLMFIGTTSGLYISIDGGNSWSSTNLSSDVRSLHQNNGKIFAGTNGEGVFVSDNNGGTWNATPLNDKTIYSITSISNVVLALTSSTVYFTKDYGLSWEEKEFGLPIGDTFNTAVSNSTNFFIGTFGFSVYRRPYTEIVSVDETQVPTAYNLKQNFPNPFNPSTTISFQIPDFSYVSLKIYDLLGNEIQTLVNELKQPGNYKVNFTPVGLASGIYFYQMRTDKFTDTKKLIFIK